MSVVMEKPQSIKSDLRWVKICHKDDLVPNSGIAALVNQQQIALYYLPKQNNVVYAVDNWDPIAKAYVMSRGIVGDQDGVLCVASPLLKQHYDLTTGKCLEVPEHTLGTWKTRWNNNELWLYTG
ncbi:nitrite reductase small subunit NirD [Photobacterium angustum]|uniref:Putative nitrite reductase NADPH (Small subunit) oxidoreductase protein n=1 Tax=Photobacterium angustum (strain S14 / CCUG 15956) TaxID=314292 RepID=Q1ZWK4_PHOAS|nr:nitrite reductase small subunit NirD [Photobacterium angustum]EAS65706.1 putative nitrite reductase NADPH (small subunit) oxidoreductase protein [Photobacterium angustum S14]